MVYFIQTTTMNEHRSFDKKPQVDLETAESKIAAVRQDIYMAGANDTEMSDLAAILESLRNGTCSPEEAVKKTQDISDRKMDYHMKGFSGPHYSKGAVLSLEYLASMRTQPFCLAAVHPCASRSLSQFTTSNRMNFCSKSV